MEEEIARLAARESGQPVEDFLKERALRGLSETGGVDGTTGGVTMWDRLKRAGEAAGRDAVARAHGLGVGVVYSTEGAIVEELPNGAIRVLHPAAGR